MLSFVSNQVGLWGAKMPLMISLTGSFGLMAGAVRVSQWKTREQPAVVEPA
jgi:hypothetical protein